MSECAVEQQNLSGLQTEEEEWLNDPVAQAEYQEYLDNQEKGHRAALLMHGSKERNHG